jgi:hypothetical protein
MVNGANPVVAERQRSLKIEVPTPEQDKPRFGRVGVIALVGFLIGILWPRLAGIKLVPSVPSEGEAPAASASAEPLASGAPPALAKTAAEPAEPPSTGPEPPADPSDRIRLSEAKIVSCRDDKGKKVTDCGSLDLDRLVRARLQALGACPGAPAAPGTLSLGLELDFGSNKVSAIESGKSTTLDESNVKGLLECAKREFASASLSDLKHDHARYTVFYKVDFLPPGAAAEASGAAGDAGAEATAASGRATVTWEVAILRSEPKEGDVVARILRGTRVVVTGRQGDWFKVKYDAKGNEAWVFKAAIGL